MLNLPKNLSQPLEQNASQIALEKKRKIKQLKEAKKLEKKMRDIEMKRFLTKEYLKREVKYGKFSLKKHKKEWEKILIMITLPRQKEEVEFAFQNFERVIDAKDFIISCLMDELKLSEQQYMKNISQHVSQVEDIFLIFYTKMKELQDYYEKELEIIIKKEEKKTAELKTRFHENSIHLKTILYRMEIVGKQEDRNIQADFCTECEVLTDELETKLLQMRGRLEKKAECLWIKTCDVYKAFKKNTNDRRIDYENLKAVDDKVQELLTTESKKLYYLGKITRKLKKTEEDLKKNNLEDLLVDWNFFRNSFLILKLKLSDDLKIDKRKKTYLICQFNEIYNKMELTLKRGINMMRVFRSCRNLQTLGEKICPYPWTFEGPLRRSRRLSLFWQKIGNLEATRLQFLEERQYLIEENRILKKQIQEYCGCINCINLPSIIETVKKTTHIEDIEKPMKNYGMRKR